MEKIRLEFSAQQSLSFLSSMVVVMTLDEHGKNYTAEIANELSGKQEEILF